MTVVKIDPEEVTGLSLVTFFPCRIAGLFGILSNIRRRVFCSLPGAGRGGHAAGFRVYGNTRVRLGLELHKADRIAVVLPPGGGERGRRCREREPSEVQRL